MTQKNLGNKSLPKERLVLDPDREGGGVIDWFPAIILDRLPAGELAIPDIGAK